LDERSDQELVGECRQGDRDAYAGLVKRYSRRIFAICYAAVRNLNDAEDLTQETLVRGFTEVHRLRDSEQFFPWIRRIARNLCMDFFRRRKPGEILVAEPPDQPDPIQRVNTDHLDLQKAIEKLPENLRSPLLFYYFDGRSTKNIAAALEISEATVHTRLSRARKELRRLLDEREAVK
jgi:RNA polymerase sigma-70 factor (ECF subfamily)